MAQQPLLCEDNLARARQLLAAMEAGDEAGAAQSLGELASIRDDDLYQSVGRIARNVHDGVNELRCGNSLQMIDESEFPDARDRLNYVLKLTDDSAHTTLSAVEAGLPLVDEIRERAEQLLGRWASFRAREMPLEDFRQLSADIDVFLGYTRDGAQTLSEQLSQVLMAQSYQDLTGQMIGRVIQLVDEVEGGLVELVARVGNGSVEHAASGTHAEGPQIDEDRDGVVNNQDDVDDLLASLGF